MALPHQQDGNRAPGAAGPAGRGPILRDLHALTGTGRYVFPGARDLHRPMSPAAINAALRRMGCDTRTEITGHGFRAMARTILHEVLRVEPAVIEHQLGHAVPDNLGGAYNRTKFIDARRAVIKDHYGCPRPEVELGQFAY